MSAQDDRLLHLLASVSDGAEVDWDRAERDSKDDEERRLIRSLRVVAGVSEFHGQPPSAATLRPGDRFKHLRILERIGSGAWGEVYRAHDTKLEREVALKVLSPEARGRRTQVTNAGSFLEEARRLASVRHPNVVLVHSIESLEEPSASERQALVLEHIEGRSLFDLLHAEGRRGAPEVVTIGIELCRALAAVHAAGLVHQDVKAENVMREEGGRIVLMDFGPGGATPLYMAPELFLGAPAAPGSDLYGVGVLLFNLATGSYPVSGRDLEDLREAHARGEIASLRDMRPDYPADLVRVIERALAPDPARRFSTAGEMERALAQCLTIVSTETVRPGDPARSRSNLGGRTPRRTDGWRTHAWRTFGIAGAALGLALVASFLMIRSSRSPNQLAGEHPAPPISSRTNESGVATKEFGTATKASGTTASGGALKVGAGADGAAVTPYTIEATLFRGRGQRERLIQGSQVAPGDSISLSLRSSEDLHVYVINEDEAGEAYLLFPSPEFFPSNPLAGGTSHVLPGTRGGREVYWQVTSAGGRERILIVASPRRLVSLEEQAASLENPEKDRPIRYARVRDDVAGKLTGELRGMGGFVEVQTVPGESPGRQHLFELAEILPSGPEETRGVWIRKLELENPGPR